MTRANCLQRLTMSLVILVLHTTWLLADEKTAARRGTSELTDTEFKYFHQKLTRMSTEKVWSIPWQLSVREARELAAKENKPVFLWISSNGGTHPLGPC